MPNSSLKIGSLYMQSVLVLIFVLALFTMINGALIIAVLVNQDKEADERAEVTREVVITVGSCLVDLPRPATEDDIRECVTERLGKNATK